jgi:hypothetical protein
MDLITIGTLGLVYLGSIISANAVQRRAERALYTSYQPLVATNTRLAPIEQFAGPPMICETAESSLRNTSHTSNVSPLKILVQLKQSNAMTTRSVFINKEAGLAQAGVIVSTLSANKIPSNII